MCVLFLHYCLGVGDCRCPYKLIVANNRDESFLRPTAPAQYWEDHSHVLAGRDLTQGGTWMGVSTKGRFAVLTNYRTPQSMLDPNARSRGRLVSDFLCEDVSPHEYCTKLIGESHGYNGFALVTADLSSDGSVVYFSNREDGSCQWVEPGTHGLSNHLLDSPWRKVRRGKEKLTEIVVGLNKTPLSRDDVTKQLMDLLSDDTCLLPDPELPDVGFSEELKKRTSAIFVAPTRIGDWAYGTRTSSVVLVGKDGHVTFTEQTRTEPGDPACHQWTANTFNFNIISKL